MEFTDLKNYEMFKDFEHSPESIGWTSFDSEDIQHIFCFENGYGASVIKRHDGIFFDGSYGNHQDLFELAVIKLENNEWDICYTTPLTNNVLGFLTNTEVLNYLKQIKELGGNE